MDKSELPPAAHFPSKPFDGEAFRRDLHEIAPALTADSVQVHRDGRYLIVNLVIYGKTDSPDALKRAILEAFSRQHESYLSEPHFGDFTLSFGGKLPPVWKFSVALLVPLPPKQIDPEPMPVPKSVSPAAMKLLESLFNGADLRVFWCFRVPRYYIDGALLAPEQVWAIENELTRQAEGQFFDGVNWMTFGVKQSALLDEEKIYVGEDGVENKLTLSALGQAFVQQHIRDLTP